MMVVAVGLVEVPGSRASGAHVLVSAALPQSQVAADRSDALGLGLPRIETMNASSRSVSRWMPFRPARITRPKRRNAKSRTEAGIN